MNVGSKWDQIRRIVRSCLTGLRSRQIADRRENKIAFWLANERKIDAWFSNEKKLQLWASNENLISIALEAEALGTYFTYSAHAEDLVVLLWLKRAGVNPLNIRYLDIGASSPCALNNTYLFYKLGASGVLVEPDPDQAKALMNERPRDVVLNVGAAFDERRVAALTRFNSRMFNTFSSKFVHTVLEQSTKWDPVHRQSIVDRIEVQLMPINEIIEHFLGGSAPHFLSIDAESLDFEILGSLDFLRYKPWVICVEIAVPLAEIEALLTAHGYQFIMRTTDNALFALDPLPHSASV